ncbi:MAG: TerB N-terminal domain-containing protein [Hyphomicrobium sp.]
MSRTWSGYDVRDRWTGDALEPRRGRLHDASAITDELEALLSVYGENDSFRGYARRFLDTVAVVRGTVADAPVLDPSARSLKEMPLAKVANQ